MNFYEFQKKHYVLKEAENKYKKYKNKLIKIMRTCKREYYCKLNNKNNMKGIWNILNSIIRKGTKQSNYPQHFTCNEKNINNMEDVVNNFNKYFANVGPDLAEKNPIPQIIDNRYNDLIERNQCSMFFKAVEEKEIIDIVKKC